jgi:hypothetical protein
MKGKILMVLILLAIGHGIFAQVENKTAQQDSQKPVKTMTAEEKADKLVSRRTHELQLTADQQTQWKAALMHHLQEKETLKTKKDGPTTKEVRKQLNNEQKASQEQYQSAILEILNPEQEIKWAEIREKQDAKIKEKKANKKEDKD